MISLKPNDWFLEQCCDSNLGLADNSFQPLALCARLCAGLFMSVGYNLDI